MLHRSPGPYWYRLILLLLLVSSMAGCKIDYQEGTLDESLNEDIPDFVLYNVKQTDVEETGQKITLSAEKAEDYRRLQETRFFQVDFRETSPSGEMIREGHTDFGNLKDSRDAVLKGHIRIDSRDNNAVVEADALNWTQASKLLTGPAEGKVSLHHDDGSSLEGYNFYADFREDTIEFRGSVSGNLETTGPSDNAQTEARAGGTP